MVRFDIISAVPQLLNGPLNASIVGRAASNNLVQIEVHDLHDYGLGKYKQIDDYPYGGMAGMVLRPEPLSQCIEKLTLERTYDEIIFFTPDAPTLNQKTINSYSLKSNYILVCGHYKGIDQRIRDTYITKEYSLGDFVISGGELAAAIFVDAVTRLIPKAIGNEESALSDSFMDEMLAPPIYTRPAVWLNQEVPEVLRNGNHKLIEEWLQNQAEEKTKNLRPDIYNKE